MSSKLAEWSRTPFWPLLAKCVLVVALFSPVVFGVLYPARKAEADAYEQAPMCATGVTDSSNCRLMTDAEVVKVDCPKRHQHDDDVCTIEMRVLNLRHFITFNRERVWRLQPGSHLRIELFRNGATGAEFNGQFLLRRGAPQEAMRTLKMMLPIWAVLGSIAAIYLYWLRRKKKQ